MYVLDTDIVTHLFHGHTGVAERLGVLEDRDVATTIVTRAQLLRGRIDFLLKAADGEELVRAQELLARTEALLSGLMVIAIDEHAAAIFDRLRTAKPLRKVGRADLLIASISLARRATLVTRNVRDFERMPNLKVVNWMD